MNQSFVTGLLNPCSPLTRVQIGLPPRDHTDMVGPVEPDVINQVLERLDQKLRRELSPSGKILRDKYPKGPFCMEDDCWVAEIPKSEQGRALAMKFIEEGGLKIVPLAEEVVEETLLMTTSPQSVHHAFVLGGMVNG